MKPVRLQRSRRKGATLVSPNGLPVVYCGRGSPWGNDDAMKQDTIVERLAVCRWYRDALLAGKLSFTVADVRRELRGQNLACWCAEGDICHVDILLAIANCDMGEAREDLADDYWVQGKHLAHIGEKLGLSGNAIYATLRRQNLPTRPVGRPRGSLSAKPPPVDEQGLRGLYYDEHRTQEQIGEVYGVTRQAVSLWFKYYGLLVRSNAAAQEIANSPDTP